MNEEEENLTGVTILISIILLVVLIEQVPGRTQSCPLTLYITQSVTRKCNAKRTNILIVDSQPESRLYIFAGNNTDRPNDDETRKKKKVFTSTFTYSSHRNSL